MRLAPLGRTARPGLLERTDRLGLDVEDARGQVERDLREALAALDGGT